MFIFEFMFFSMNHAYTTSGGQVLGVGHHEVFRDEQCREPALFLGPIVNGIRIFLHAPF